MALRVTYQDIAINFADRGAVDGTPTTTTASSIKSTCRVLTVEESVGIINTDGMGDTAVRLRPTKSRFRISFDNLIESAVLVANEGNYGYVTFNPDGVGTVSYNGVIESFTVTVNDNQEAIQRVVINGPADQ